MSATGGSSASSDAGDQQRRAQPVAGARAGAPAEALQRLRRRDALRGARRQPAADQRGGDAERAVHRAPRRR